MREKIFFIAMKERKIRKCRRFFEKKNIKVCTIAQLN